MSEASEHPVEPREAPGAEGPAERPDPAAWAAACQEDLDAERARRQQRYGRPPVDPARELRLLADAVTEQIGRLGGGLGLGAAPLVAQARAVLEPVIERNADTLQHLAAAGQELLAAYRSAVERQEQTWARPDQTRPDQTGTERPTAPNDQQAPGALAAPDGREPHDAGDDPPSAAGSHRIDLD